MCVQARTKRESHMLAIAGHRQAMIDVVAKEEEAERRWEGGGGWEQSKLHLSKLHFHFLCLPK
jgi:hypothetical protein